MKRKLLAVIVMYFTCLCAYSAFPDESMIGLECGGAWTLVPKTDGTHQILNLNNEVVRDVQCSYELDYFTNEFKGFCVNDASERVITINPLQVSGRDEAGGIYYYYLTRVAYASSQEPIFEEFCERKYFTEDAKVAKLEYQSKINCRGSNNEGFSFEGNFDLKLVRHLVPPDYPTQWLYFVPPSSGQNFYSVTSPTGEKILTHEYIPTYRSVVEKVRVANPYDFNPYDYRMWLYSPSVGIFPALDIMCDSSKSCVGSVYDADTRQPFWGFGLTCEHSVTVLPQ